MSVIQTGSKKFALGVTMAFAAVTATEAFAQYGQTGTAATQTDQQKQTASGTTTQGASGTTGSTGTGATSGTMGASGAAGTGTAAGAGQKGQPTTGRAAGTTPHVFVLIPADMAAKETSAKRGCWAKIYDRENYMGDSLTLTGPISLADMAGPFGLNWDDRVNSIEIGPKATLTVFDNEGFRDQVGQFKSGQKVPDISKKLGFFDEFASVRMTCSK